MKRLHFKLGETFTGKTPWGSAVAPYSGSHTLPARSREAPNLVLATLFAEMSSSLLNPFSAERIVASTLGARLTELCVCKPAEPETERSKGNGG
jgi:hypothetical protein